MATKYQAIGPDGTVFKRKTESRKYVSCVIYWCPEHSFQNYKDETVTVPACWKCAGWQGRRELAAGIVRQVQGYRYVDRNQIHVLEAVEV